MRTQLVLMALLAAAAAKGSISFGPLKNYPNLGFMFPCIANAKADPLPMPEAHPYLLTGVDGLVREDRFSPLELWYHSQCCGRWSDPAGNRIVLGRMTHIPPAFESEFVSRARFGAAVTDDAELDPKSEKQITEWVATFANVPVGEPKELKLNAFSLDDLLFYPSDATNTLIYAFRPRRLGNAKNLDWFCVLARATGAVSGEAFKAAFEEQFIGKIALPSRASRDEGVAAGELEVSRADDKAPDLPNHPIRLEARKSIENYESWWYAETDGYILLSDVSTDVGKALIHDIQDTLPALRQAYSTLMPPLTQEKDVALIRMFQKREDYVRYVGKDHAWSGGIWMPARRELVLTQESSKEDLMRVLRHEAFHQYLSHAYCMLAASPWLNEGHACFFENASVNAKGKVTIDEDPDRVQLLLDNITDAVRLLPELLQASYADFYGGTASERSLKYAMAWGLAYYFQKGAPQELNTTFKSILPAYAAALAETHDYHLANAQAFKDADMNVFQENFREFWLKRRGNARHYDPLDR